MRKERGGNVQITIYFSQVNVGLYSLNDIMYNEYHDYPLIVATAECFVLCMKWQIKL